MAKASGFNSMTEFTAGPCLSIASMRARYFSAIERAVNLPDFIPSWRAAMVISSNSKGGTRPGGSACRLSLRHQRRSGRGGPAEHSGPQEAPAIQS